MKVNGIMAEYNPFHNGHIYHLEKSKEVTGAEYTIIVMSGNFVQRGAPALVDKFIRTKMALENGADLVIELPSYYSVSSAEYFAKGGVSLLDKLGVVDYISFGSETGDIDLLRHFADILLSEPEEYREYLHRFLREGMSFPLARNNALIHYDPSLFDASKILASPNNILAIEYIKALNLRKSGITPIAVPRVGSPYHDRFITDSETRASAQAIREAILSTPHGEYKSVMPENAYNLLQEQIDAGKIMDLNDFSAMLYYKLLLEKHIGYASYLDVTQELSDRIINNLNNFVSVTQFADLLKTKDRTYTRITRCLMHILLDITQSNLDEYSIIDHIPYARVLGFRKEAQPLLTEIKMKSSIPLITNIADAKNALYEEPGKMLRNEIRINEIYYAAQAVKTGTTAINEFTTPIVII